MRPRHSLHIGCPTIVTGYRRTWKLVCHSDGEADAAASVAGDHHFDSVVFKTPEVATRVNVRQHLNGWTGGLDPIDVFLTFAGHGTERALADGAEQPSPCGLDNTNLDEFLILNGGALCDHVLANTWLGLPPGSHALMVADCCHGGGTAWMPSFLKSAIPTRAKRWVNSLWLERLFPLADEYECPALYSKPLKSAVVLLTTAMGDDFASVGLMSALKRALESSPPDYNEWILRAKPFVPDGRNILHCRFGPGADEMWAAPPLDVP